MTAWMLLYIGDEMCLSYYKKSEWVVDRIKISSLNASLGGVWIQGEGLFYPILVFSLSVCLSPGGVQA